MLSVMADGSTIYPNAAVAPTPRYDKGVLFATGQDPVRKDVLEIAAAFVRPRALAVGAPRWSFAAPLPELEAIVRRGGPEAEAVQWIGPEGTVLQQGRSAAARPGAGTTTCCIRTCRTRCGPWSAIWRRGARTHPSFGGVAIQLSARGFAQLPGPEWGLDDETIAPLRAGHAAESAGIRGKNATRSGAEFLNRPRNGSRGCSGGPTHSPRFYRQLQAEVTAARPRRPAVHRRIQHVRERRLGTINCGPRSPRRPTMTEALLRAGFDVQHYQAARGPVLLRGERIVPASAPAALATNLELNQTPDADRCFQNLPVPGSVFFHPPQETPRRVV